jgi:hypothetical protein
MTSMGFGVGLRKIPKNPRFRSKNNQIKNYLCAHGYFFGGNWRAKKCMKYSG